MCASDSTKSDEGNVTSNPVSLVSKQAGSVVLLQTLTAKLAGTTTSGRYRVLFDGGISEALLRRMLLRDSVANRLKRRR